MSLPTAASMSPWLGVWSRPPDRPAQVALALAVALVVVAAVPGGPRWLASRTDLATVTDLKHRRRFLAVAAFVAAFVSLGYIAFYLRGGPRADEASTYWLQGRAMSHGVLSWSMPEPSASFRARGLVVRGVDRLAGAFPPGYPMLLALGFLVGAPMLVGPVLAAALTVATWWLAHELAVNRAGKGAEPEAIARTAAGLSILSVALRYYTADALPQGAAALAVGVALASALRARRVEEPRLFALSGLAVGLLIALRPVSAAAVGLGVAALATGTSREGRGRRWGWALVAMLPGLALLLMANHAATGHALVSPRSAYWAMSVGPGPSSAPGPEQGLLQRAREHLQDIANFEPLAVLAAVPLLAKGDRHRAALIAWVLGGEVVAQWAFHAGGAPSVHSRSLVAIVPLEHALMAVGIGRMFPRSFGAAVTTVFALALAGFAVHAVHGQEALARADGGRPRFEPDVARDANVAHGLLFFEDDSGYELAYDPTVSASHGVEAARMRGDDHDRLLYDSLGHPPAHRYVVSDAGPSVSPWTPPNAGSGTWRFEGESDWPPLALAGGRAESAAVADPCASGGRVLRLTPDPRHQEATTAIALPVPHHGASGERSAWRVVPRVLQEGGDGSGTLTLEQGEAPLAVWEWTDADRAIHARHCLDLPARAVELAADPTRVRMVVRARGGSVALDRTTLGPSQAGE